MKQPAEIWTEDQARAAHNANRLYCALVGSIDKPFCFLEINEKFVGVGFLDEHLRESLYYAFKEIAPGKLFLSMATHRDFEGDTDKVLSGTSYIFDQDGSLKIRKQHFNPHSSELAESATDVANNYAAWPEFGEYDDLIKVERGA